MDALQTQCTSTMADNELGLEIFGPSGNLLFNSSITSNGRYIR
jgi:hypothetical protein